MSNWLSDYSGEEQAQVDAVNAKGIKHQPTVKKEIGLFDGSATAIPRGVVAGAVKTIDTIAKPFERVKDHVSFALNDDDDFMKPLDTRKQDFGQYHDELNVERKNTLVMEIEQLEDKQNTGLIGNIGFGLSDYLTRAALGSLAGGLPGAAAVTGISETNYSYDYLTNKGVDEDTALGVAVVDGVVAGGATVLPLSYGFKGAGGIIKDAALSVGGATAITTGGQYASGEILKSEGYEKQAQKYEITKESVGTELILNGLLFGAGRFAQSRLNADAATELNNLDVDRIEAKNTQIESALVTNELEFENTLSPVQPADPIQHNNHLKNLDTAQEQILTGRPVNVPHAVQGKEKRKPVSIAPSEYKKIRYDDPRLDSMLHSKAKDMDMDWAVPLLLSIRRAGEKSHNWQVSPVGAQSIMQIMPNTKAGLERNYKKKWDVNNPEHATEMALYLVREMSQQYKTKDPLVLAAHYNGGFANGKAMQKNGKPKAQETINYVNRVKGFIGTGKYKNYSGNNISTAIGMDGSSYQFADEIKSLGELITSNDSAYGVNPKYPSELQPRDRTREASRQQIENMANDLRPELFF